jgi:hypothetical protein
MSVIGLTDDKTRKIYALLGKLRKGDKKTDPKKPGRDLTYLRFDCTDPDAVKAFEAAYGREPRAINCFLPYASVDDNFVNWREEWGKSGLRHRCDGQTMVVWWDESRGIFSREPRPCPYADLPDHEKKCRLAGNLHVIVPELKTLKRIEVVTSSIWDFIELHGNLLAIEEKAQQASAIARRNISIASIPLILVRSPRMVPCPVVKDGRRTGERVRREIWLLHVEVNPAWWVAMVEALNEYSLPAADRLQLAAPMVNGQHSLEAIDVEAEYIEPEPETGESPDPPPPSENGGQKFFYRPDFIVRIRELEAEAAALGDPIVHDEAVLDEMSMKELTQTGKDLASHVAVLKSRNAAQGELPF